MSYTIRTDGLGEYTEKKSVFTGRIRRCTTEEEAKDFIESIRKAHRNARHHVFAYIIGEGMSLIRYSDDGEPQGTGGFPVLHVLEQHDLKDVCLVVSRFFGGVLLGAPGLTRAYGKAAAEAVAATDHWQVVSGVAFTVDLSYEVHARLKSVLDAIQVQDAQYGAAVRLTLVAREGDEEALKASLRDHSQGQVEFSEAIPGRYFLRRDGFLETVTEDN